MPAPRPEIFGRNRLSALQPERLQQDSPGQRPGSEDKSWPSPERAQQTCQTAVAPFQGKDLVPSSCSQGVALGWFVSAPSGRWSGRPVTPKSFRWTGLAQRITLQRVSLRRSSSFVPEDFPMLPVYGSLVGVAWTLFLSGPA